MRARRADDVVLVHAIATYADCANEYAVAIKAKRTGENRDPVWKSGIQVRRRVHPDSGGIAMVAQ